mgnify:CR=1 FL=1
MRYGLHTCSFRPSLFSTRGAEYFIRRLPALLAYTIILLSCALRADIIWLANGKAVEGSATLVDDKIRVIERDGKGEFELSTAAVVRVDVGIWLEDLDPAARSRTQRAMATPTIAAPAPTLPGSDTVRRHTGIRLRSLWPEKGRKMDVRAYTMITGMIGFVFFSLLSTVCFVIVVIAAFRHHVVAGLLVLFVPLAVFVYLFTYYTGRKGRMFLYLISPMLWSVIWILMMLKK